jgi:hypothetical protein
LAAFGSSGFNAVLVNLIEHKHADDWPRNKYGDAPFTTPGDFSTPNEVYFAHADWVIQKAGEKGMLVIVNPCYTGTASPTNTEGWKEEIIANGPTKCRNYGRYVGNRYKNYPNIIWQAVGDMTPPSGSRMEQNWLDGVIGSNGVAGSSYNGSGAGGSGGSIWVTAATLQGAGYFQANGGGAGRDAGGGSGGRVAVYYEHAESFLGFTTSTASGGDGSWVDGAAGSVLFARTAADGDHLHVYQSLDFPANADVTYASITVHEDAILQVRESATISAGNVTVESGARFTTDGAGNGVVQIDAVNLTVQAGGVLSADGGGHPGGYNGATGGGPGGGVGGGVGSFAGGGSYGGRGGGNTPGTYGSPSIPTDLGPGGGSVYLTNGYGGAGGGALRINVSDTLTLDGEIRANGLNGSGGSAGGGSGGSIWVSTESLGGNGEFHADGGMGNSGGGGGGGRVAVYYTNGGLFTGHNASTVDGGEGTLNGEVGTIRIWSSLEQRPFLIGSDQRVFFDVQQVTGSETAFEMWSPQGDVLFATIATPGTPNDADIGPLEIHEAGIYALRVYGPEDESRAFDYRLWDVPDTVTRKVGLDGIVTGAIGTPGEVDQWEFLVEAGRSVTMDVQKITKSGQLLDFKLNDPDGNVVFTTTGSSEVPDLGDYETLPLTSAGMYTLHIDGQGDDTAGYRLTLSGATPPRIVSHAARSSAADIIDSAWLFFSEAMSTEPDNFVLADDVLSFTGPAGEVQFTDSHWADSQTLVLTFDPQPANEQYLLTLGPDIRSTRDEPLDQDADGVPGEALDDQFFAVLTGDSRGPYVFLTEPMTATSPPLDRLTIHFSEPIDRGTLGLDDISSFKGPDGSDLLDQIEDILVAESSATVFFAPQTLVGDYRLTVGPSVNDLAANPMDQDRDGVPGEPEDAFVATVTVNAANLVVESISDPVAGIYGDTVDVNWSVSNDGSESATGKWHDYAYLSSDRIWDLDDPLVGIFTYDADALGPLEVGQNYQGSLSMPLPGIRPGEYHLLVRSNLLRELSESRASDNTLVSTAAAEFSLPILETGVPQVGEIDYKESLYYQIDVLPEDVGKTLVVRFETARLGVPNELYIRFNDVPSRSTYDQGPSNAFASDQWVIIPDSQPGTYFVLAITGGNYGQPGELGEFIIRADLASPSEFLVLGSDFGQGGTAGNRTIEINGVNFDRTLTVSLSDGAGFTDEAVSYYRVGSEKLYATFDLTQVAPGTYDVVFENSVGQEQVVAAGFEVVHTMSAAEIDVNITAPPAFRRVFHSPWVHFPVTVTWRNEHLNDLAIPILQFVSTEPFGEKLADVLGGGGQNMHAFFGLGESESVPGILMPGDNGSTTYQVVPRLQRQVSGNEHISYTVIPFYDEPPLRSIGMARKDNSAPPTWPRKNNSTRRSSNSRRPLGAPTRTIIAFCNRATNSCRRFPTTCGKPPRLWSKRPSTASRQRFTRPSSARSSIRPSISP